MQEQQESFAESTSNVSLREYIDILRRRRAVILQTFVIILIIGVVYTMTLPPVFQAEARLLVEPQSSSVSLVNGQSDPLADLFQISRQYSVPTQVELLQTPEILKKVASKVGPTKLPKMTVEAIENTSIIEVTAEGDNPELVAGTLNTLLRIYVEDVADRRGQELKKAIKFAQIKLGQAKQELQETEAQIQAFKRRSQIAEIEANRNKQVDAVENASASFRQLQNAIVALQTRMASTKAEMARLEAEGEKTTTEVPSARSDAKIVELEDQIATLQIQRDSLTKFDFRPNMPQIGKIDYQLKRLNELLAERRRDWGERSERKNPVYEGLRNNLIQANIDLAVLYSQSADASKALQDAQQRMLNFPQWETQYDSLVRRRDSASKLATSYGDKLQDLNLRMETRPILARIMEEAQPPLTPIRPNRPLNIIFAGLLGLFLGLGVALLQELFDDRINSPEESERVLRLPNLGHVPLVEEEGLRLIRDISTFSPLMESYRSLRTNINFAAVGTPIRSLVVTSSIPAEGKSTTIANLAMAMAYDGKRVVIVDADLRRPSQHHLLKLNSSPGLTDILVGTHRIEDVMVPVAGVPGVSLIPAGSPPPNPAELLGSSAMGHFLGQIETMVDIVLIDTPPTLAVADSVVLSARADGVLLVIGYGDTKKANVRQSRDALGRANANLLGTVMNRIDSAASGYYYGKYYVPVIEGMADNGALGRNGAAHNGTGDNHAGELVAPGVRGEDGGDSPTRITLSSGNTAAQDVSRKGENE